jgi:Fe-S-cluster containining protein
MPIEMRDDDELIDPTVHCDECEAVCCRLLVIVEPEDRVPRGPAGPYEEGLVVMLRNEDGWCAALDRQSMSCSIYELRPDTCRRFTMGGGYCRAIREDYRRTAAKRIPHVLVDAGL